MSLAAGQGVAVPRPSASHIVLESFRPLEFRHSAKAGVPCSVAGMEASHIGLALPQIVTENFQAVPENLQQPLSLGSVDLSLPKALHDQFLLQHDELSACYVGPC